MKIVFMGTSTFAVPALRSLVQSKSEVAAVVTTPDKPAGRGLKRRLSATKQEAEKLGLQILQPENINSRDSLERLREYACDLFVVAAYGQILSASLLRIPAIGSVNLHASLLPKYRGAAPIQRAIMAGEKETGTCTIWMTEGMDEGDIILNKTIPIAEDDTYGSLSDRLARAGADLLLDTLDAIANKTAKPQAQDPVLASYAPLIMAKDRKIIWEESADRIYNRIRALNPSPGAYCLWQGKRLKILKAEKTHLNEGKPGQIIAITESGPMVSCAGNCLLLSELQLEGGKRMCANAFLRGHRMEKGEILT